MMQEPWTLISHWHSSCKRRSSAGQPATSSPGNRPNSSNNNRANAVLASQGNSPPVPGHHKQGLEVMGDHQVADLQIRELSHSPTPSCSGSQGRGGLSRHPSSSTQQRGPPWAVPLGSSSVGGGPRSRRGREMFEGSALSVDEPCSLLTHSPANPSSRGQVRSTSPG